MKPTPRVREALYLFSVDLGLSDADAEATLDRMLSVPARRDEIRRELEHYRETGGSWNELLSNDDYAVDDPESEVEARALVLDILGDEFRDQLGFLETPQDEPR